MSTTVSLVSLNVNGLNTPRKRDKVMTKLKRDGAQIVYLQETHLTKLEHDKLKKYGFRNTYSSWFKNGPRRGVTIMISNQVQFKFEKEIRDGEGRYIIVKGMLDNVMVTLVNIYAPPDCDKHFFRSIFDVIAVETEGILICGGDFNVVLNHNIDTTSEKRSRIQVCKYVNTLLEDMGLTDIWRSLHPLERDFTHYSAAHKVHSRIDYLFVDSGNIHRVKECHIGGADVSDHNPVYLDIVISDRKRLTNWRMNIGLLNNDKRKERIKLEIQNYVRENDNGMVKPTMVWDALKAVMRGKLISESTHAKKTKMVTYKNNMVELRELEREYQKTPELHIQNKIKLVKLKVNEHLTEEIERKILFTKQSYYEVGPRATKLLARRTRKQLEMSQIHKIRDPQTNNLTTEPKDIERIFLKYYKELYEQPESADREEMRAFLNKLDLPSIGEMQNDSLTREITIKEVDEAINGLKNAKSPGSDGYPVEWYKAFRNELSPLLVKSFNWTLQKDELPPTWTEAIITVLPKPGRDRDLCASYRPISLLNVDYKIYTSIISKRLDTFTTDLIDEDQTGFVRGRQTQDNIRRTLHIIDQANKQKRETVLVSIDAEKAFDRVNWTFLFTVLERFGFNERSIRTIQTLYQRPTARLKINGSLTGKFELQRSTRQGCCLSPTLFAYFIEPLAEAIRENKLIQGVTVCGVEQKVSLFADDVIAYVERPSDSIPELLGLLESYGRLSGYKINITKTQILTVNYTPSKQIRERFDLNWNLKKIKYLGIEVTRQLAGLYKANYEKINCELLQDIHRWSTLTLDFSSRIELIRMNVLPRLLYLFQSLPIEIPQTQFTSWDKMISRFIWNGKRPRVRFKTLQLQRERGGLSLPNLKEYFHAAQLKYVACWCRPDYTAKWKEMEKTVGSCPIQNIIGDKETFRNVTKQMDSITRFTMDLWFRILRYNRAEKDAYLLKWVAFDSKFKPTGQGGGFGRWVYKGITAWCTLVEKGEMVNFQELKNKYDLDWREFYRYLQMRDYYEKQIRREPTLETNEVVRVMINAYKGKHIRAITTLYKALMIDKSTTGYIREKWETEFNIKISEDDWDNMWKRHKTTTSSRAWREFSWKNLIRFFITPKISNNYSVVKKTCWRSCGMHEANHAHIFWNCYKIKRFWEMVHQRSQEILGYEFPMDPKLLYLSNYTETEIQPKDSYLFSILMVAAKKTITRKWGSEEAPTEDQWVTTVGELEVLERLTHRIRLKASQMDSKWEKWMTFWGMAM